MLTRLEEIFWDLDKMSTKWSGYFDVYERHVSKFVGKSPKILEIGVLGGGSLEMWCKYFGEGTKAVGIDINPECLNYKYDSDVKIVLGNQEDSAFWEKFFEEHGEFDIIIDDGGHTMQQQIVTLDCCFPKLRNGGVMVVEDTHTSYWTSWGGGNHQATFLAYAKEITDELNRQHHTREITPQFEGLYSTHFYNSQVVFEKEALKSFHITDNREHKKPE